jgi:hypothetical protein
VIASTGYTPQQVDRLTLPQYERMMRYWRKHPPIHLMIQSYLGIKGEEAEWEEDDADFDRDALAQQMMQHLKH